MRAQIKQIFSDYQSTQQIQLFYNQMTPIYVQHHFAAKRYKKVGKQVRQKLLKCIQKGWTIINVAKKFSINYSTAKSIVQNQKKKKRGFDTHSNTKISSTDQCQSPSIEN